MHDLPSTQFQRYFPITSSTGNLVTTYDATPAVTNDYGQFIPDRNMIVIDKTGQVIFDVALPKRSLRGVAYNYYHGPVIDKSGSIWMVADAENNLIHGSTPAVNDRGFVDEDAMLFDGATGDLIMRKNIFRGITFVDVRDRYGNPTKSYNLNGD